jgi:hypothetical protein
MAEFDSELLREALDAGRVKADERTITLLGNGLRINRAAISPEAGREAPDSRRHRDCRRAGGDPGRRRHHPTDVR